MQRDPRVLFTYKADYTNSLRSIQTICRESSLTEQSVQPFRAPHVGQHFVVDFLKGNWTNAWNVGFFLRVFVKSWHRLSCS